MRQVIALAVILVGGLSTLFTFFALAMRRDFQQRFQRVRRQMDEDATALVRHLFD